MLTNTSGRVASRTSAAAGNAGLYSSGSCATGYATFVAGPRIVYRLALGDSVPLGGRLTLSTCGLSAANTVLYLGTGCPTRDSLFNCLKGNDDAGRFVGSACGSNVLASTLTHVTASRVYYVQVGEASGAEFSSGLSWNYTFVASSGSGTSTGTASRTQTATRTRKVKMASPRAG